MMEHASDQQLFNLCNEAILEKMKCTEVRVRGLKSYLSAEQELMLATFLNYLTIYGAALDFVTPEVIRSSFRHAGIYPISAESAKAAMDRRLSSWNMLRPPFCGKIRSMRPTFGVTLLSQVLAAQDYALQHGGVTTVTTVGKRVNLKCSVTASPDLLVLAREA